jgi:dihydrofolate synthase / folylpolyglutamate synthase
VSRASGLGIDDSAGKRPEPLTAAESEAYRQTQRAILARAPEHDLVPSLDRIAAVMQLMGEPQHSFRAIHLTGTNGKSSTTRMVERLLREHGLRTGRFVSPHLSEARERIAVDGENLSPQAFTAVYDEVLPYLEIVDGRSKAAGGPAITFFETLAAMAYAVFADAPVDVAAVEVGMGGAWDATNVIAAPVAVVTPIALDHQHFLGHDLASIATEKAGIIKPGAVAVLAAQSESAAQVLHAHAARVGARVLDEGVDFALVARDMAVGGQLLQLRGVGGTYRDVFLPLHGAHQATNAAAALAAVEVLLGVDHGPLDGDVVRAAFADVDSPGRLEVVRRSPTVLVDAAHNPAGAEVLATALEESFAVSALIGVVGVLADKDAEGILAALEPVFDEVVVTASSSPRAMDVDDLAELARDIFGEERVHVAARLDSALDLAAGLAEYGGRVAGAVVATGSVTVAADVRALFRRG